MQEIPTQITVEQPKQNNFIVILLSILLLISCVIAGFFAYQTQKLVNELRVMSDELKQTQTLTPEPTVDLTSDWKTYTNEKYGFSFKYPNESIIKKDMSLIDGLIEFDNFIFLLEKTDSTLTNYVNKLKDTNAVSPTRKTNDKFEALEWIGSYKNTPTHYMSILNNGSVFNFGITTDDMSQFVSIETKLLDQILNSLKFLDDSKERACVNSKYVWLSKYNECESPIMEEAFCKKEGGTFLECQSACRHDDPSAICTTECIAVCKF